MGFLLNIVIDQGADYNRIVTVTDEADNPKNLTGYTVTGAIRKDYESLTSTPITTTIPSPPTLGQVKLSMVADDTATLEAGRYVYAVVSRAPGSLLSVVMDTGGTGYTADPTVTITGDGSGATAHTVRTGTIVTSIVVDSVGANYTSATVTITGGSGSGATAHANLRFPTARLIEGICTVTPSV